MTYIIDNVKLFKGNKHTRTSLLVEDRKILSVKPSFNRFQFMKIHAEDFIMTPTHVYYSDQVLNTDSSSLKKYFLNQFLLKGSTFVLASSDVKAISEIDLQLEKLRIQLKDGPLDYTLAIKISIDFLSVPLIKQTKLRKIPAIFVQFSDIRELYKIPWSWIREALFPYNSPLIPVINPSTDKRDRLLATWNKVLNREKIPHIGHEIQPNTPINQDDLRKIGIYPKKGYLQVGGELSYNLYLQDSLQEEEIYVLNENNLAITVHKGQVVRAGDKIYYLKKHGEELIIHRPAFFR